MVRYQKFNPLVSLVASWGLGVRGARILAVRLFKGATVPRDRLPDGPGGERERPA